MASSSRAPMDLTVDEPIETNNTPAATTIPSNTQYNTSTNTRTQGGPLAPITIHETHQQREYVEFSAALPTSLPSPVPGATILWIANLPLSWKGNMLHEILASAGIKGVKVDTLIDTASTGIIQRHQIARMECSAGRDATIVKAIFVRTPLEGGHAAYVIGPMTSIEDGLLKQPGVVNVSVSVGTESGCVSLAEVKQWTEWIDTKAGFFIQNDLTGQGTLRFTSHLTATAAKHFLPMLISASKRANIAPRDEPLDSKTGCCKMCIAMVQLKGQMPLPGGDGPPLVKLEILRPGASSAPTVSHSSSLAKAPITIPKRDTPAAAPMKSTPSSASPKHGSLHTPPPIPPAAHLVASMKTDAVLPAVGHGDRSPHQHPSHATASINGISPSPSAAPVPPSTPQAQSHNPLLASIFAAVKSHIPFPSPPPPSGVRTPPPSNSSTSFPLAPSTGTITSMPDAFTPLSPTSRIRKKNSEGGNGNGNGNGNALKELHPSESHSHANLRSRSPVTGVHRSHRSRSRSRSPHRNREREREWDRDRDRRRSPPRSERNERDRERERDYTRNNRSPPRNDRGREWDRGDRDRYRDYHRDRDYVSSHGAIREDDRYVYQYGPRDTRDSIQQPPPPSSLTSARSHQVESYGEDRYTAGR